MSDVLRDLSRVQAVRPTCHWWRCPRLLAWFRVLMMVSLVKHPASAGLLSRIGDYLLLQHEGLGSDKNITDSAWPGRHQRRPGSIGTMTRSPPQPLFHRRVTACSTRHHTGDTDRFQLVIPLPVQRDSQGTFVPCEARLGWYAARRTSSRQLRDTTRNRSCWIPGS
jgi:hypothetical protein